MSKGVMIQSIERAILILDLFSEGNAELKLQEICERLNLNKSTAHGILSTLKYYGLIAQNEENQKYRLGLNLIELGYRVQKGINLRDIAAPVLKKACAATGESVHLGILDGFDVVYIDKRESNQSVRISTSIGARNPAYSSAIGRAILAFLPKQEQADHLPETLIPSTKYTVTNKDRLMAELQATKEKGYAVVREEFIEGLLTIGAPIFNFDQDVAGGISFAAPAARVTKKQTEELAIIIHEAAEEISMKLGCMMTQMK